MLSAIIIFLAVIALIAAATFYKVRKIHIASMEALHVAVDIRKEVAAGFVQERWNELLTYQLGFERPLPPTRGWAGSPDFLFKLARYVTEKAPRTVIECSSGVSTLTIARTFQQLGGGHVYSLEHDAAYAALTRQLLIEYGVQDYATVLHAPLVQRSGFSPWYDDSVLPTDIAPVDMLVVDGPPMATSPLARYPALPILLPKLASTFAVFVDDADRDDEREMLRRWEAENQRLQVEFSYCEKGLAIVRRS